MTFCVTNIMGISLPNFQSLTREQLDIYEASRNKNLAVYGGPGTGKSIMALYRAYSLKHGKTRILTYNKNLVKYLDESKTTVKKELGKNSDLLCNTFDSFFGALVGNNREHNVIKDIFPNQEEEKKLFHIKKHDLAERLCESDNLKDLEYRNDIDFEIIDEAQDLNSKYHGFFAKLNETKPITILADENQTIEQKDLSSTKTDINKIYKTVNNEYYLTKNFRNTKQIYSFAKLFNLNEETIQLESVRSDKKPQVIYNPDIDDTIKKIYTTIDNNPDSTIGIFIPYLHKPELYNDFQSRLLEKIKNTPVKERFSSYFGNNSFSELDFNNHFVHLLSFKTIKGLEYDIVIIPFASSEFFYKDVDETRYSKTYVALTRAKYQIHIYFDNKNTESFIIKEALKNKHLVDVRLEENLYGRR